MGLAIANNETRMAQFAMVAEKPFQLSQIGLYSALYDGAPKRHRERSGTLRCDRFQGPSTAP